MADVAVCCGGSISDAVIRILGVDKIRELHRIAIVRRNAERSRLWSAIK
jgi:hypothetical protein